MKTYKRIIEYLENRGEVKTITWTEGFLKGSKYLIDIDDCISVKALNKSAIDYGIDFTKSFLRENELWQSKDGLNFTKADDSCYVENLQLRPRIFIFGAGHVNHALYEILKYMEFQIIIVDERKEFANRDRFKEAYAIRNKSCQEVYSEFDERENDYVVIATPGHSKDRECAEESLKRKNAYVGMIGSEAKVSKVKKALLDSGISKERIDELYAPIGLKIGGRTPIEIAISITAEIVEVKNSSKSIYLENDLVEIIKNDQGRRKMMATIISKEGSGPRDPGSRMIVDEDGKLLAGTIGGGSLEGSAQKQVKYLLNKNRLFDIEEYDLTDSEAAELGMICGGRNRVMFEAI